MILPENSIEVSALISVPVQKAWSIWINEEDIQIWNSASEDWHTPKAFNDFSLGGRFLWRMETKDGSIAFDFSGTYTDIELYSLIAYTIDDGRKVTVQFKRTDIGTKVIQHFQAENQNTLALQKEGWQSILSHFKQYAENH